MPAFGLVTATWAILFKNRNLYLVVLWFGAVALAYNFMSTSFAEYKPLVLFSRYLYPVLLPSVILTSALVGGHLAYTGASELAKERRFWATIILFALLAYNIRGLATVANIRPEAFDRTVSTLLSADDVIFSDYRTIGNLVFLREGLLAKSSATNRPWENTSLSELPDGAYVLINEGKLKFLASAYKYVPPMYALSPPASWKKVYSGPNGHLYRAQR